MHNKGDKSVLGFSLEDISSGNDDFIELQKKVENSQNYARTVLYLAWMFFEEKKTYITNKDYSKVIKKAPQNSIQFLETFVIFNVLNNLKRGKFRAIIYHLKNPEILRGLVSYAKKTLELK